MCEAFALTNPAAPAAGTEGDEWGTPPGILELSRRVLGGIDLDPASNARAQAVVRAARWYSKEDDGLAHDWRGRVWLNPPYSRGLIGRFTAAWTAAYDDGTMTAGLLLVNAMTSSLWWRRIAERFPLCLLAARVAFLDANGVPARGNARAQSIHYTGPDVAIFRSVFGPHGRVMLP